jgi:hypothetical protein
MSDAREVRGDHGAHGETQFEFLFSVGGSEQKNIEGRTHLQRRIEIRHAASCFVVITFYGNRPVHAHVQFGPVGFQEQAAQAALVDLEEFSAVNEVGHRQHPVVSLIGAAVIRDVERRDAGTGFPQRQRLGART